MMKYRFQINNIICGFIFLVVLMTLSIGCNEKNWDKIKVSSTLEDIADDGNLYTPSTQSFLRGEHWLESVSEIEILSDDQNIAKIKFIAPNSDQSLKIVNLPLDYLVPRLHYQAANPPDKFDAFNLMLAEFSRNSVSTPVGKSKDQMSHFETSLAEEAPWQLTADYNFLPNEFMRPVRIGLINNCLKPGLWELSASDRSGEIYHSWFNLPKELYAQLLATANGIDQSFATKATKWNTTPVLLDLNRLRQVIEDIDVSELSLCPDADAGYSSQDSRRKLAKGYVMIEKDGIMQKPENLGELTTSTCYLSNFVEPGKYSFTNRREFDLSFLSEVKDVEVKKVSPMTDYNWLHSDKINSTKDSLSDYLELILHLEDVSIIIGNLPMHLLVPQEDFSINGFGVGILSSSGIAERRKYLIEEGPAPSFAYLCEIDNDVITGLNSHDFGIEQIFIRTHINESPPWWEVTVTSFERMVDLVKYRIEIPETLRPDLENYSLEYISPLYRTYRDDNLR